MKTNGVPIYNLLLDNVISPKTSDPFYHDVYHENIKQPTLTLRIRFSNIFRSTVLLGLTFRLDPLTATVG